MKSHDLANRLLSLPNRNVFITIDMSTDEDTAFNRAFSKNVIETIYNESGNPENETISILSECGQLNYDSNHIDELNRDRNRLEFIYSDEGFDNGILAGLELERLIQGSFSIRQIRSVIDKAMENHKTDANKSITEQ